ncbi:hypothetical protein Cgig2_013355 [Carnegiea gigantea]|uniref:Uncharacterized protein n=1 Tax=Carnegiea gigantea TaxID=171969 RepID=A0A9Q1GRU7_9CARY|nr:hypothetical protein Cgig2_013351 [Carnegiea gigantea]KAJ8424205.1 hypothetical protein Cgig2_013355 [Carnegiea gigantea]
MTLNRPCQLALDALYITLDGVTVPIVVEPRPKHDSPYLAEALICGKTLVLRASGGIYLLVAAAGAAGIPTKVWPALTDVHVFHELKRLLALSLAYWQGGIACNSATQRKQHLDSPLLAVCYIISNAATTSRSLWIVMPFQVCLKSLAISKYIQESSLNILVVPSGRRQWLSAFVTVLAAVRGNPSSMAEDQLGYDNE